MKVNVIITQYNILYINISIWCLKIFKFSKESDELKNDLIALERSLVLAYISNTYQINIKY